MGDGEGVSGGSWAVGWAHPLPVGSALAFSDPAATSTSPFRTWLRPCQPWNLLGKQKGEEQSSPSTSGCAWPEPCPSCPTPVLSSAGHSPRTCCSPVPQPKPPGKTSLQATFTITLTLPIAPAISKGATYRNHFREGQAGPGRWAYVLQPTERGISGLPLPWPSGACLPTGYMSDSSVGLVACGVSHTTPRHRRENGGTVMGLEHSKAGPEGGEVGRGWGQCQVEVGKLSDPTAATPPGAPPTCDPRSQTSVLAHAGSRQGLTSHHTSSPAPTCLVAQSEGLSVPITSASGTLLHISGAGGTSAPTPVLQGHCHHTSPWGFCLLCLQDAELPPPPPEPVQCPLPPDSRSAAKCAAKAGR